MCSLFLSMGHHHGVRAEWSKQSTTGVSDQSIVRYFGAPQPLPPHTGHSRRPGAVFVQIPLLMAVPNKRRRTALRHHRTPRWGHSAISSQNGWLDGNRKTGMSKRDDSAGKSVWQTGRAVCFWPRPEHRGCAFQLDFLARIGPRSQIIRINVSSFRLLVSTKSVPRVN